MKAPLLGAVGACMITLVASASVSAAVTTYVSRSAFETAIAGLTSSTVDFDSATVGDTIASGDTFDDLTFTYALTDFGGGSLTMVVDNTFDTTSPPNYLGLQTDAEQKVNFLTGDAFTVGFAQPVQAFGLNFVTNDVLIDGDSFSLDGEGLGQPATLSGPADPSDTLGDGGEVYFLGMVSDQAFNSVVFSSLDTGLEFTVDDITSAYAVVPLPSALWLMGAGLLSMAGVARRARGLQAEA